MNKNELKKVLKNDLYRHSMSWTLIIVGIALAIWAQHAEFEGTEVIEISRMVLALSAAMIIMVGWQLRDATNIDEIYRRLNKLEGADDESDAADDD